MEADSKLFVNSSNAIPGNSVTKCDTSSAAYQSEQAGLVDRVGTEEEILEDIRTLVCMLPSNHEDNVSYEECTDDLNRACENIENAVEDTSIALQEISDDHKFFEAKRDYAKDMVTAFIKLNGMTVGAIANRSKIYDENAEIQEEYDGSLSADGAGKAARFVEFCDAFNIPVLTLTNVTGFKASSYDETHLAREAAKLTYAFANATVPKVNVIIGKAYGSAYVTMNSKGLGADMVFAWPEAEIGMMDAELAAKIMYADADVATIREKASEYKELQSNPLSAARRGYVDTIIQPKDTRKYVIGAFEMLFTKREDRPMKKHGTV
jgi:acetyl-CoA carboxylase carboxyltransferase component